MPTTRPSPSRDALLAAIPTKNQLVRVTEREGGLRLTAPRKPNPLAKFFSRGGAAAEKSFDLDDLGTWTWRHIDGRNCVEDLIRQFAKDHRVSLREAEVALLAFLKTLVQRNLVGLQVSETR